MKFLPNIILNFHAIKDPKWFEHILKIIQYLYHPVSYEDIENYYRNGKTLKHACHITFDDGHISFYDTVFPLLKQYNIPASIFVSPKVITERTNFWFQEISDYDFNILNELVNKQLGITDDDSPVKAKLKSLQIKEIWEIISAYQEQTQTPPKSCMNMSIQQIKEIQHSGLVHIGAHTMNHPILKNETQESLAYEIGNSIVELSDLLQTNIKSFAYPNGNPKYDFGEREMKVLQDNEVKLAFSTEIKPFTIKDNPLSIPRSGFEGGSAPYIYLKLFLGSNWERLKILLNRKDENSYRV